MQGVGSFLYIAIFFAILYFFLIRPQQKQQKQRKQMLSELKVNDEIVTVGGIHGKIVKLNDNDFLLRVGDRLEMKFDRNAVGYVKGKETPQKK
ncbi:MAG: preprotein translocase subunit YajC [Clostridia bacterium]|nr:protein translocase subunit yajC [Clostridiales bacterium]MDK2986277.1 preprotein translocase subunit YajC [Clostridia bacterium]